MTRQSEYAAAAIALVLLFLVANRLFGFVELKLIVNKVVSLLLSLKSLRSKAAAINRSTAVQLQGRRDWQLIWQNVREFAEKHNFKMVKMHLHLPWLHEFFHARYDKSGSQLTEQADDWYFVIPLNVGKQLVGELDVVALKNSDFDPYETIRQMMEMVSDLEPQFVEIMESATWHEQQPAVEAWTASNETESDFASDGEHSGEKPRTRKTKSISRR
jgi:UDP-GlcNAc:undecaprenyl-phosphate GlcNAc-1-phosphate transferase